MNPQNFAVTFAVCSYLQNDPTVESFSLIPLSTSMLCQIPFHVLSDSIIYAWFHYSQFQFTVVLYLRLTLPHNTWFRHATSCYITFHFFVMTDSVMTRFHYAQVTFLKLYPIMLCLSPWWQVHRGPWNWFNLWILFQIWIVSITELK